MARLTFDGPNDEVVLEVEVVTYEGEMGINLLVDDGDESVYTFIPMSQLGMIQEFIDSSVATNDLRELNEDSFADESDDDDFFGEEDNDFEDPFSDGSYY